MPVLPQLWYFSVSEEWCLPFFPLHSLLMMTWSSSCFVINLGSNKRKRQNCAYATKETIYVLGVSAVSLFESSSLAPMSHTMILPSLFPTTFEFMNSHVTFLTWKTFLTRTFEPCLQVPCAAMLLAHCRKFLKTELALEFSPWMANEYWIFQFDLCLQITTKCCFVLNFTCDWEEPWLKWLHWQCYIWITWEYLTSRKNSI